MISSADNEDLPQRVIVKVPAEIWTCEVSASYNPNAESEAMVIESIVSEGSLERWSKAHNGSPPMRTLAALVTSGLMSVSDTGEVLPSEAISEAIEDNELIEFLKKSGGGKAETKVVRDLLTGGFHHPRVLYESAELSKSGGQSLSPEPRVARREGEEEPSSMNVRTVLTPVKGSIAYALDMRGKDVLEGSSLLGVEVQEAETSVTYRWHKRQGGTVVPYVHDDNPLAQHILDAKVIPELEVVSEENEVRREWPPSPELEAIAKLDVARKIIRRVQKGHVSYSGKHLQTLVEDALDATSSAISSLERDDIARLDNVRVVVGTEFEQWNSVQCVINSAKNKCVLLSAFTHEKFADEAAARISESLPDGCEILLLSGEPDRINEPTFVERTAKYGEKLSKEGMPKRARIEATKRACHAKFVISDTGMVWIGSCNLLSAAPTSWVLESGLVIEDRGVASEIINHVIEEEWLSEESSNFISSMIDTLPQSSPPLVRNGVRKRVDKLVKSIKGGMEELGDGNINQNTLDRLLGLISMLLAVCERPQWSLVKTDQHRPAMLDLIRQSRKRIVIGSDAVRKRGLDRSTIREISSSPADAENRASKFTVQIFWGRQDPKYVKGNNEEIKDARARIKLLREEVWKNDDRSGRGSLRSKFLPHKSLDTMITHCKFISVDDERLLLTSDNLLSFSDDEGWDSDARELGILIDSPRIARLMRGEMELLTPTCRDFWDRGRWHAAIASAIEECGGNKVPLEEVMESLIGRIIGVGQLSDDWFQMKENMKKTYKIPDSKVAYALVMEGAKDGLYEVNYPGANPAKNLSHDNDKFKLITLSVPNMKASWESRTTN